ncbi:MAG TPA: hypothetical protein VLF93_03605, partial [Candidatus Saccharimonadales bacterium]|nr:hypothetical protein [Candidatus Saccharimonadales bacterium]
TYMDQTAIGVVSTNPGYVLDDGTMPDPKVPVALSGRVPVNVSTANGDIHAGDYLTTSTTPGVAVKATQAGSVIGKALSDYTGSGIGQVTLFVSVGYADPNDALSKLTFDNQGNLSVPGLSSNTVQIGNINTTLLSSIENALTPSTYSQVGNALASGTDANHLDLSAIVNTMLGSQSDTQASLSALQSQTVALSSQVADLANSNNTLLTQVASNSAQIAQTTNILNNLNDQIASATATLSGLQDQIASGAAVVANLTNRINPLLSGINSNYSASTSAMTIDELGRVGIGTTIPNYRLDIHDATSSAVAQIVNESSDATSVGLQIKLGTTSPQATNKFVSFVDGNGDQLGSIRGNGTSNTVTFDGNGGDFAEYFQKSDPTTTFTLGDIICHAPGGGVETCGPTSNGILGIYSNDASFVGAGRNENNPDYILVGLIGQLEVNVASDSQPIRSGDPITYSTTTPGKAVRATVAGQIIGRALTNYDPTSSTHKLLISINVGWFDPSATLAGNGNISVNGQPLNNSQLTDAVTNLKSQTSDLSSFEAKTQASLQANENEINSLKAQIATLSAQTTNGQPVTGSAVPVASSESVFALSNLSDQITELEKQILNLNIGNSSASNSLSSEAATISGTLNVFGKTTLNDLGVTGNITAGVMTIQGLDASGQASINTIGALKLQDQGAGGLDILNGKIKVDTSGNFISTASITAKKFNIDTSDVLGASLGTITIKEGQTQAVATTSALTKNSKIFATPIDTPVAVSVKKTGENTFIIKFANPQAADVKVNWWIVN